VRGLPTSHQKAISSTCSCGILGPEGRKSSSRRRPRTKSQLQYAVTHRRHSRGIMPHSTNISAESHVCDGQTEVKNECKISTSRHFKLHHVILARRQLLAERRKGTCLFTHIASRCYVSATTGRKLLNYSNNSTGNVPSQTQTNCFKSGMQA
jgi:hypothetical protein